MCIRDSTERAQLLVPGRFFVVQLVPSAQRPIRVRHPSEFRKPPEIDPLGKVRPDLFGASTRLKYDIPTHHDPARTKPLEILERLVWCAYLITPPAALIPPCVRYLMGASGVSLRVVRVGSKSDWLPKEVGHNFLFEQAPTCLLFPKALYPSLGTSRTFTVPKVAVG